MSETEKEILELRQLVESRFAEYKKRGTLLDGDALDLIRPHLARLGLPADVAGFAKKSEESLQRQAKRRKFLGAAILPAIIVTLSCFTFWNILEREKANEARGQAEAESRTSTARFLYAQALLNLDTGKAPPYLAASLRHKPLPEARILANRVLWDANGEEAVEQQVIGKGKNMLVSTGALSPDGRFVAAQGVQGKGRIIRLWDLRMGTCRVLEGHGKFISAIRFSPDGASLASASWDKTVRLWDITTGKARVLSGHEAEVQSIAFSPDGKTLASASSDGDVRLWDLKTSQCRVLEGLKSQEKDDFIELIFSSAGKRLFAVGCNPWTYWDLDGTARADRLSISGGSADEMAVSPNGGTP